MKLLVGFHMRRARILPPDVTLRSWKPARARIAGETAHYREDA